MWLGDVAAQEHVCVYVAECVEGLASVGFGGVPLGPQVAGEQLLVGGDVVLEDHLGGC
jgi:hypothetical protein